MHTFLEIARTGLSAVLLHPARSAVTATALIAILVPYCVGLGISRGLTDDAELSIEHGADLYVSAVQLGRPAPIPLTAIESIDKIPGVTKVTPRIVGRIQLGKDRVGAVLVGVPVKDFPDSLQCIDGRLYRGGNRNELVVGSDLAKQLSLEVGALIPPFYRSARGERVSEVVGIFRSDVAMWQARLIVTSLETAAHILDQPDVASDLLLTCQPGYEDEVRRTIERELMLPSTRPRVVTRDELAAMLPQGPRQREGAYTALFVLAFAVGILVVLVTSGFGLTERRREIAILKATGWQTDQLLLRSLVESFILSLIGASIAVIIAFVWLRGFNGWWIASVFLPGADATPGFRVPFRLSSLPVLLAFLIALVVVMSGSLYSTWRAAIAPPREALR